MTPIARFIRFSRWLSNPQPPHQNSSIIHHCSSLVQVEFILCLVASPDLTFLSRAFFGLTYACVCLKFGQDFPHKSLVKTIWSGRKASYYEGWAHPFLIISSPFHPHGFILSPFIHPHHFLVLVLPPFHSSPAQMLISHCSFTIIILSSWCHATFPFAGYLIHNPHTMNSPRSTRVIRKVSQRGAKPWVLFLLSKNFVIRVW